MERTLRRKPLAQINSPTLSIHDRDDDDGSQCQTTLSNPDQQDVDESQLATQLIDEDLRLDCGQSMELDDEAMADILCILHPASSTALQFATLIAEKNPECTLNSDLVEANTQPVKANHPYVQSSEARTVEAAKGTKQKDIVLRLSALPKDPIKGFCFGRNSDANDFPLNSKRISHTHFRIYVNEHGTLMVQDSSRNGTYVDTQLLRAAEKENDAAYRHTLEHGAVIKILNDPNECDHILFIVRIPRREGEVEEMYENNLNNYFDRLNALKRQKVEEANPSPLVLFPHATSEGPGSEQPTRQAQQSLGSNFNRRVRNWKGGNKYNFVKKIGQGTFASVYKITQKNDGKAFAAKELDKSKFIKNGEMDPKFGNELKIMMRIHHENIVKFIEHVNADDYLYIIMELVPGGDLGELIRVAGSLGENQVRDVSAQLLDALSYLHSRNITHRDIKPDNILLANHSPIWVKLSDFGLSKMIDNETFLRTFCGTLLYCAPEVYHEFDQYDQDGTFHPERPIVRKSKRDPYSKACDLWSLAGVLFFSLCGEAPFRVPEQISSHLVLLHIIMTSALDIRPLQMRNLSEDCIRFLKGMLQKWPDQRPSVEKLQAHSWLTGIPATQTSTEEEDEVDMIPDPDATELARSASYLSVENPGDDEARDYGSIEEIDRNNLRLSLRRSFDFPDSVNSGGSSGSESFGFMKNIPDRALLFGEVLDPGSSALGSSGVAPNRGPNFPMSTFGTEQSQADSDMSDRATSLSHIHPLLRSANALRTLAQADTHSYQHSPSLLGTESVFGHLQVRSPSAAPSPESEMAGSPEAQSPEGNDPLTTRATPSFVTAPSASVRRQREEADATDEPERKRRKGRAGDDFPIDISHFWDTRDMSTWHDDYPKLTHGELKALEAEAAARGEKYIPPRTTSTPKYSSTGRSKDCISPTPSMHYEDKSSSAKKAPIQNGSFRVPNPILAKFVGHDGSALPSIAINVTEEYTSWGRGTANTHQYSNRIDTRVAKYVFKLILWNPSANSADLPPSPDSIFYLATKAYGGLKVNGKHVPTQDRGQFSSSPKHWVQLKHGDIVTTFDKDEKLDESIVLRFECYFGASKKPRSPGEAVTFMPAGDERTALETKIYHKDAELFDIAKRLDDETKEAAAASRQQSKPSGARTIATTQPDNRSTASGSMSPVATTSNRAIAKHRSGGPLARVREASGVPTNPLPIR